eukprot:1157681-Pelagomonas_calceolata.AAC.8
MNLCAAKRRGDQSGVGPSRSPTPPASSKTRAGQKDAKKAAASSKNGSQKAAERSAGGPAAMEVDGQKEGGSDDEEEGGSDGEDGGAGERDQGKGGSGSADGGDGEGGPDREGSVPPSGGNQEHAQVRQWISKCMKAMFAEKAIHHLAELEREVTAPALEGSELGGRGPERRGGLMNHFEVCRAVIYFCALHALRTSAFKQL